LSTSPNEQRYYTSIRPKNQGVSVWFADFSRRMASSITWASCFWI